MDRRQFLKSIGTVMAGVPVVGLLPKPSMGGVVKPRKSNSVYCTLTIGDSVTNQTMTVEVPASYGLNLGEEVSVNTATVPSGASYVTGKVIAIT